ncbi:hypothetical protein Tco_0586753 [Tanacetum coccineum]
MKRGFRGAPRPLLPAMLLVATTNPSAGQEHPDVAQSQPSSSTISVPSTSLPPVQSPPPPPPPITTPIPASTLTPIPETDPEPMEQPFEEPSPAHQHFSPPQENAQEQMTVDDLLQLVPQLMTRVDNSKEEEPEDKGRKSQDDPLVSLVQGLVTPPKTTVNALGEEQVEYISPNTLEAAKTLSKEEASLAEAIRLDTLEKEEEAKQVHLDSLLAQRIAEEELNEQQKKRRAQSVLGSDLQGEDFAKKMVELVNQRKKHFANKPMTQSQLRTYMMNYLKNQGTWKLSQLKNLSFEEVKEEFDKLVKQVESFAPINFEATKDSLKRFGEELQTKTKE